MTTEIYTWKIMSQRKIGGSDLPPHSHERWHGNMGTGTDFWELINSLLPRPTQEKKSKYSNNAFLISSSASRPIGAGINQQYVVNGHWSAQHTKS